jgi:hypothetical protein
MMFVSAAFPKLETRRIMLNPVGRAGVGIVSPLLKAGDSNFATVNWNSLDRAINSAGKSNGTIHLPAGPIYLDSGSKLSGLNLDETRAFITVRGMGRDKTVLVSTGTTAIASINFASSLVGYTKEGTFTTGTQVINLVNPDDESKYLVGDVIYFWTRVTSPTNNRSARQRTTVFLPPSGGAVTVTDTIGSGYDDYKHVKGFAISGAPTAGDTTATLVTTSFHDRFNVGDDILIGDGPGINEFFGEWVRLVSVNSSTGVITFAPPLQQSYGSNLGCVVPGWLNPRTGRRQHMTDIVFRDLSICAPTTGDYAGVFGVVRAGARIRFENVGFIASPFVTSAPTLHDIAFATCGNVTIRDGQYDGNLSVNLVQQLTIDNIVAGGLAISEFSRGCNVLNVITTGTPGIEIGSGLCTGINLVNCTVRGDAVMNIFAEDAQIENLTAPQLNLLDGSNGVLTTPLAPDPTQVVDGTDPGDWLAPLQSFVKNRKVVTDAVGHVTLELEAIAGQTANLQEWQNSSGAALVSISAGGTFTILGSGSKSLSLAPAASGVNGIDMFTSSGGALRLGTSFDGGVFQAFSNSDGGYPGQTYIDCGNQSTSAVVLRTANSTNRFSITHNGDAVFLPATYDRRGLVVRGLSSQTGDLQQWQNNSTTPLFAIRADGQLATANSESSAPPSTTPHRLKIYDTGGTLIGYIPIYPSS